MEQRVSLDRASAPAVPAIAGARRRQRFIAGWLCVLAVLAVLCLVPYQSTYVVRVADSILIYILLGLGLNIVVGYAGLLDLGFVAFYAVGAYAYALLASPQFGIHLPFILILPIAVACGGLAGVLLGIPVLRLRGDYLAIVTLGFGEIIRVLVNNMDAVTNGPKGVMRIDKPVIADYALSTPVQFYWLLLIAVLIISVLVFRLESSILGRAWSAIREDQDAARGIGINTTNAKLAAFAISAMIGAFAGVIFASFQRFVSPESFSLQESILIVLIIVIGGVGNIFGVMVGATVLLLLPEVLRDYAELRMLLLGLVMAVLIVIRPQGLVPRRFGPQRLFAALWPP